MPYSGKFLWEKIFANFADTLLFVKLFPANFLLYYIALSLYIGGVVTHAIFSAKIPILRLLRKLSPVKISHYTVLHTQTCYTLHVGCGVINGPLACVSVHVQLIAIYH